MLFSCLLLFVFLILNVVPCNFIFYFLHVRVHLGCLILAGWSLLDVNADGKISSRLPYNAEQCQTMSNNVRQCQTIIRVWDYQRKLLNFPYFFTLISSNKSFLVDIQIFFIKTIELFGIHFYKHTGNFVLPQLCLVLF